MTDQPLQPFAPPASLTTFLPNGFSAQTVLVWFLIVVLVFWAIYTLVAIYHWLKYSHASWIATPAIATHLAVSFILILYLLI